jgi:hypothetical protein
MSTLLSPPTPPPTRQDPGSGGHPPPRSPRPRRLLVLAVVALLLVPTTSYARALSAPGGAGWQVQSVEWVRDHGGARLVNTIENWWYSRRAPSGRAPAPGSVPSGPADGTVAGGPSGTRGAAPARITPLTGASPLPGEGHWVPGRTDRTGAPALYTTFVRPAPATPSVVAGVAWMRASDTSAHLGAGLTQPGGGGWPGGGRVPAADVPALVATFNAGWKFSDMSGGFYLDGRTGFPLRDGLATVVIDARGRVLVGQWGRDVRMGPNVRAVRQNLALVVDQGQAVPGLAVNGDGRWGSSRNQLQFTWRSGLGTDAAGNLIYVAGNGLTLRTLADAMVDAGIRQGMELDIHPRMVAFSSWRSGSVGTVSPTKLVPDLPAAADRYLSPDQRDFFYVTLR